MEKRQFFRHFLIVAFIIGIVLLVGLWVSYPAPGKWYITVIADDARVSVNGREVPITSNSFEITDLLVVGQTNTITVTALVDECRGGYDVSVERGPPRWFWWVSWLPPDIRSRWSVLPPELTLVLATSSARNPTATCPRQRKMLMMFDISPSGELVLE